MASRGTSRTASRPLRVVCKLNRPNPWSRSADTPMPRINIPGCGHGNFIYDNCRFWDYTNKEALGMLKKAFFIIENSVKGMRTCNDCFKRLPGGRAFSDIWNDNAIWVNYEPRIVGWYGATNAVGGNQITISQEAFNKGRWWVAGTLVHELAHANGASSINGDADNTLLYCGLKNAYEGAIGRIQAGARSNLA